MHVLYGGRYTRSLLVEMVLTEGGIPYEVREVDILAQEHRSPDYLAINPAGRVPALLTPEGATLYETPAINLYLAERHGLKDLAPDVGDPQRGAFLSGLFYLTDELEPAMKRYYFPQRYVLRAEDTQAMKHKSLGDALEHLEVIEHRLLTTGPHHLGARFSLVDLTLAFWTASLEPAGRLEAFPAVQRCARLVADRPKLRAMFAALEAEIEDYARLLARGTGVA